MPDAVPPGGPRSAAVKRAVSLHRRSGRLAAGAFLAEGPQAVREAVAAGAAMEVLTTPTGAQRYADVLGGHRGESNATARVTLLTAEALARACDASTPQPIAAICRLPVAGIADVIAPATSLAVLLVECQDPGNVGTVVRLADAVGADGVILTSGSADPYGPKAVRASVGSIFHLPVVTDVTAADVLAAAAANQLATHATVGVAGTDLFDLAAGGELAQPTLWLFGNEAKGLPPELQQRCSRRVTIPIFGRAESLNLAAAAAVCLYESARSRHR